MNSLAQKIRDLVPWASITLEAIHKSLVIKLLLMNSLSYKRGNTQLTHSLNSASAQYTLSDIGLLRAILIIAYYNIVCRQFVDIL